MACPDYDDAAEEVRLDVFSNVYAALPLPSSVFVGPHDALWKHEAGRYRRVWSGERYLQEVPNLEA